MATKFKNGIDVNSQKITSVANPTASGDAIHAGISIGTTITSSNPAIDKSVVGVSATAVSSSNKLVDAGAALGSAISSSNTVVDKSVVGVSSTAVSSSNKLVDKAYVDTSVGMPLSSECATCPRYVVSGTTSFTATAGTGQYRVARAIVRTTQSFTAIRFMPSVNSLNLTYLYACAWSISGTLLGYSNNFVSGGQLTANTLATSTAFNETSSGSMTLTAGTPVFLGMFAYGSSTPTFTVYGYNNGNAAINQATPTTAFFGNPTWTAGTTPPNIATPPGSGGYLVPVWVELGYGYPFPIWGT